MCGRDDRLLLTRGGGGIVTPLLCPHSEGGEVQRSAPKVPVQLSASGLRAALHLGAASFLPTLRTSASGALASTLADITIVRAHVRVLSLAEP